GVATQFAQTGSSFCAVRELDRSVPPWSEPSMCQRWIAPAAAAVALYLAVSGAGDIAGQLVPRANWIWFDEGDPLESAPAEKRYFRHTFDEGYELAEAEMHITCDNEFVLFINGKEAGRSSEWSDGRVIDVKPYLERGRNVIAIEATNQGGPAGLVAWLVRLTK